MCGIAAVIRRAGVPATDSNVRLVRDMLAAERHRGDKDHPPTTWSRGCGALGSVRLAIVDQAKGNQPLVDQSGSLGVTFNGEIYNYAHLRAQLELAGYIFTTGCDTEVLLHGYRQWGNELPEHLRGMYAFVIYDAWRDDFLAARDPLGIKPLYVRGHDQIGWIFASELKAAVAESTSGACGAIEVADAGDIEIRIFPPGGRRSRAGEQKRTLSHWFGPRGQLDMPFEEAAARLRDLIRISVSRMLAMHDENIRIGVLCSGGIDSAALLFEAADLLGDARRDRLTAFCVGAKLPVGNWTDDSDPAYAQWWATQLGVPFRFIQIDPSDMVVSVAEVIGIIESFEPNHIRAGTANLALARAVAKDGVTVVLCGEGADELLGGYQEYPQTVDAHGYGPKLADLFERFICELHRTQLQRVDRVTMACGVEARVPYLDEDVVRFAWQLVDSLKVRPRSDAHKLAIGKWILRFAYRDYLPMDIVERRKVPMGEGAGVGDNGPRGPFHDRAKLEVSEEECARVRRAFPQFNLTSLEDVWYFNLFRQRFGPQSLATDRPKTNLLQTFELESNLPRLEPAEQAVHPRSNSGT